MTKRILSILLCMTLLWVLPPSARAERDSEPDPLKAPRDLYAQPEPEGAELSDTGPAVVTGLDWEQVQLFPGKQSALIMAKAVAPRTGTFTWSALRLWTPDGLLAAEITESSLNRTSSHYWFWYDLHAAGAPLLEPDSLYYCQLELRFDGRVYRSPEYELRTEPADGDELLYGIDVSEWQGMIDWERARDYIDYAIIRCGYGSDYAAQDDDWWERNASECERLGIPYGVYLYSYANTEAKARSEAEHVLRLLRGHSPSLPVYYDLEDSKTSAGCTNAELLRYAQIFAARLEAAGWAVGFYSGGNWWRDRLTDPFFEDYDRWIAAWGGWHSAGEGYSLWQYSCTGRVPGISGDVDLNVTLDPLTRTEPDGALAVLLDCGAQTFSCRIGDPEAARFCAAVYDGEGRMVQSCYRALSRGGNTVILRFDDADIPENGTVRLFVLDAEETPLADPQTWKLKQ